MKKPSHSKKLGFSLIELSLVIVIIGILILGVTKGSTLMKKTRIRSAQALTTGSPVASTSDLIVWYETSLDSSFNPQEAKNGTELMSGWKNNSPSKDNDALHSAMGTGITYKDAAINNLPAVNFNKTSGTDLYLAFNCAAFNQKYHTIFVVEQRQAATSGTAGALFNFGGTKVGYTTSNNFSGTNNLNPSRDVGAFSKATPRIFTILLSPANSNTRGLFLNGGDGTIGIGVTGDETVFTAVNTMAAIGTLGDQINFYTGDVAEIIMFNRALTLNERNEIQTYLGKKYAIKVAKSN